MQPVYGVGLEPGIGESIVDTVEGYRGMKPVRIGNQAHEHLQHDVYGQIVLPLVQAFYDQRLLRPGTVEDFHALEKVGERAFAMHDQTDAGLWEFRTIARVHTYSSVMCWAACDRLAKAADHLGLSTRGEVWRERATIIRERVERETFLPDEGRFAASFGGRELDASLLQLTDLGFLDAHDPRQVATFDAIERDLKKGFRRTGDGVQLLHLLVHRSPAPERPGRRSPGNFPGNAEPSHRGGLAERRYFGRGRRTVGQLSPDLFSGRHHQLRRDVEPFLDRRALNRRTPCLTPGLGSLPK